MNLSNSLRLENIFSLAAVGAEERTTALFLLARELSPPVVITTMTHLHKKYIDMADSHYVIHGNATFENIFMNPHDLLLLTGPLVNNHATGLDLDLIMILHKYCQRKFPLLISVDVTRRHPLKTSAIRDQVIPNFVSIVIVVAEMDALEKPLARENVRRSGIFSQTPNLPMDEKGTIESVTRYLIDKNGVLKGIPSGAKRVVLLNHSGSFSIDQKLYQQLLLHYNAIITASLKPHLAYRETQEKIDTIHEPVSAIILAAGEAKRFGSLKQLISWSGKPLVRHIVETTLMSKVSQVILVTGAGCEKVESAVEGLPITIMRNPVWKEGISSSIHAGLEACSKRSGAAIFILADQPALSSALIDKLIDYHSLELPSIVVPQVNNVRSNPVLFDKRTFTDLLTLQGDEGGKQLFSRFQVSSIQWEDERLCKDIDTEDDYYKLLHN